MQIDLNQTDDKDEEDPSCLKMSIMDDIQSDEAKSSNSTIIHRLFESTCMMRIIIRITRNLIKNMGWEIKHWYGKKQWLMR